MNQSVWDLWDFFQHIGPLQRAASQHKNKPGDQALDALQALQWTLASGRVKRLKPVKRPVRRAGIARKTRKNFPSVRCQHDLDESDEALTDAG